ncbi:MAG: hypothetical protein ACJA0Q_001966 [Saprospiraceae bacterium]|jgi:hypothetical protein
MFEGLRNEDKEQFNSLCVVLFFRKSRTKDEQVNSKNKIHEQMEREAGSF